MYMPQQKIRMMRPPTEDKDDEEKDSFYVELETVYSQCPKHDIKMVLGDYNAKVGKEENNYPYAGRNGCMRNVMETGINWYSLPPQQICLLEEPYSLIRIYTK